MKYTIELQQLLVAGLSSKLLGVGDGLVEVRHLECLGYGKIGLLWWFFVWGNEAVESLLMLLSFRGCQVQQMMLLCMAGLRGMGNDSRDLPYIDPKGPGSKQGSINLSSRDRSQYSILTWTIKGFRS